MMPLIFQEIKNENEFNPLEIRKDAPFAQAFFYGEWQKGLGRKTRRFIIKDGPETAAFAQVVKYPLILGKSYLYIPYGPVFKNLSPALLEILKNKFSEIMKEENAIFARFDFDPPVKDEIQKGLIEKYFQKAPAYTYHSAYFQPRSEWILDLNQPEEKILAQVNKKTRYCFRQAEKGGVKIEIVKNGFQKYFGDFCALMEETAKRDKFHLHPRDYYEKIFEDSKKRGNAYLAVGRLKDEILTFAFVLVFGKSAYWLYGGSSNKYRDLAPSHLTQWQAIRYAKKIGLQTYNFGGVATDDKIYQGWEGLSLFKKRFGGQILEHSIFYDLISQPFWYNLYNLRKFVKSLIANKH